MGISLLVFVLAAAIQVAASGTGTALPGWEETLLTDLEYLAILCIPLSAFLFGVVMPLTE
ncbi:hypothetical protein K933_10150 [Candidatus Halobonum tyrrellensis G22]|uniref:Uncharacterized protein n=1 Tax=Candidatus Halobonum tyrrellensis G22 TaxID=1324957 RepID=V4HBY8_9EURY|nr:hypothetical protein K933_10150 [Candidatus Halobonum tyrrellensis G22]